MKYYIGDIVRLSHEYGLYEVTGSCNTEKSFDYDYTVTNDECVTEPYAKEKEMTLVCRFKDRKDI